MAKVVVEVAPLRTTSNSGMLRAASARINRRPLTHSCGSIREGSSLSLHTRS